MLGGIFSSKVTEFDWNTGDEVWSNSDSPPLTVFSPSISGAQKQPNGNTLICEGLNRHILEVTASGEIV